MSIDGLDIRSCNRMDSVTKERTIDVSLDLSNHLGGLVFKEEQKLAVEALPSGKDVMAVLPTGFGCLSEGHQHLVQSTIRQFIDLKVSEVSRTQLSVTFVTRFLFVLFYFVAH